MIKTVIKLKILKFILIGGISAAYVLKRYCDKKDELKIKKKIKKFWRLWNSALNTTHDGRPILMKEENSIEN